MSINWVALVGTFSASLLITLAIVGSFSTGVSALARRRRVSGVVGAVTTGTAAVSFTLCAGAVGYGLYLIASR